MLAVKERLPRASDALGYMPPLQNGDRLRSKEFLRRYETMPEGKLRLRVANEEIFYYPDVMVACDPRDTDRYFKRYPKVLVEVLSESTEPIDRREKFLSYRQIETLEEYVLVAQDKMEVTVFRRESHWQPGVLRQPDQLLRMASLDFTLPLTAVYEGVKV